MHECCHISLSTHIIPVLDGSATLSFPHKCTIVFHLTSLQGMWFLFQFIDLLLFYLKERDETDPGEKIFQFAGSIHKCCKNGRIGAGQWFPGLPLGYFPWLPRDLLPCKVYRLQMLLTEVSSILEHKHSNIRGNIHGVCHSHCVTCPALIQFWKTCFILL